MSPSHTSNTATQVLACFLVLAFVLGVPNVAFADSARFQIPAEPLPKALKTFARQANMQLLYEYAVVRNIQGSAVIGVFNKHAALKRLLNNPGLEAIFSSKNSATIRLPSVNTSLDPSQRDELPRPTPFRGTRGAANEQSVTPPSHSGSTSKAKTIANQSSGKTTLLKSTAAESPTPLHEVVVTGTRLKLTRAQITEPVTIITANQIKRMGYSTLAEVIQSLPENVSTINDASSVNNNEEPADAQGQSAANLFGLGPQNTLVLVNGHRVAASPSFDLSGSVVNLNTIPMNAVARIEITTGGASAEYGSSAVAGVINIILRKHYHGAQTELRESLGHNGGDKTEIDQTFGENWSTGNLLLTGRFSHSAEVLSNRAGITTDNYPGVYNWSQAFWGQPGIVFGVGSLPASDPGTSGIAGKLSPANDVPWDPAVYPYDVLPESKSTSVYLHINQELTKRISAYADFTYTNHTSLAQLGPIITLAEVPTTNVYNNLGRPVFVGYVFDKETEDGLLLPRRNLSDQYAFDAIVGTKVRLSRGWRLDVSLHDSRQTNNFDSDYLNPTLFAERVAGVNAQGQPLPAAQQLNLFGNGTAQNAAALAGLISWNTQGQFVPHFLGNVEDAEATVKGQVHGLPAGSARVAIGAEHMKEGFNFPTPQIAGPQNPSRSMDAAYGEVNVPIVSERNRVAGIYSLNLYGAVRWQRYYGIGSSEYKTVPKFGISWFPVRELKLRSTYGIAFVAPTFADLAGPSYLPNPSITTPIVSPNGGVQYVSYFEGPNPHLQPETANEYTVGLDYYPRGRLRGFVAHITYNRIDFENIVSSSTAFIDYPNIFFNLPGVINRNSSGQIASVNFIPINLSKQVSQSVDSTITYRMATDFGEFEYGLTGLYTIRLMDIAGPGLPAQILSDTAQGPNRVTGRMWINWTRGSYGMDMYVNYQSSYNNSYPGTRIPSQRVAEYTTLDLTGFYNLKRNVSVDAGIRNLTNHSPPFFNFSVPFDPLRVSPIGRVIYLDVAVRY